MNRRGAHRGLLIFALLSLSSGQTTSPTSSPSPTPSCYASPGFYCSNGSVLMCPVGAYCAGGVALNVSCYPTTACAVAGLSAQPPCFWNVSTLAGSGAAGAADGAAISSSFNTPSGIATSDQVVYVADFASHRIRAITMGVVSTVAGSSVASFVDASGTDARFSSPAALCAFQSSIYYVADSGNHRVRKLNTTSRAVTTIAGSGTATWADGLGTAASFNVPFGITVDGNGTVFIADRMNQRIRKISPAGLVTTLAGSGTPAFADGIGAAASFKIPSGIALNRSGFLFVGDSVNYRIRIVSPLGVVSTLAGDGTNAFADGMGTNAKLNTVYQLAFDKKDVLYFADELNNRIRSISPASAVNSLAGDGSAGFLDNFGALARLSGPQGLGIAASGTIYVADYGNNRIRQLTCVPCPVSFYCSSGAPVLCPAGSYCPLSSVNATACPVGTFSAAGASACSPCPTGTSTLSTNSTACGVCAAGYYGTAPTCSLCPRGHYCPVNSINGMRLNCGRGNYCPLGSDAPRPCPLVVAPIGGWPGGVQGPAFAVETAQCMNQCSFNVSADETFVSMC